MENQDSKYIYSDVARREILALVPNTGQIIGSIGCGYATTESVLVEAGREVHGVDLSEEAILVAKTRISSARVVDKDELMPFAENSLDGLILADVLEHLPMAWERLDQYAKMIKKGGWIIISVPNMRQIKILYRLVIRGDWPEKDTGVFDKTHIQFMTDKRLMRWTKSIGLTLIDRKDSYDYNFWPYSAYEIIDKLTFRVFRSFLHFQTIAVYKRE